MPERRSPDVFSRAVDSSRDVSESFWENYGGVDQRIAAMGASEAALRQKVRRVMESKKEKDCFLFRINELAEPFREQARSILNDGRVAAVDGTNAMAPISHMSTSSYIAAVELVTRLNRNKPEIWFAETSTQYLRPEEVASDDFDLKQLCDDLDKVRDEGSWVTTFREYVERDYGTRAGHHFTILDGPILTQNLLTQARGRELYKRLFADRSRVWVGVIKDISGTETLGKWCGYSLFRGEGFVISSAIELLRQRFDDKSARWVASAPEDIVRVVYRPGEKAFGYECRLADLGLVTAVLLEDASPTLHHETPLLLEIVDSHLRGGFRASDIRDAVIGRLQRHSWQMGINAVNERDLR